MNKTEKNDNFLPSQSTLLIGDKNIRTNYFESKVFFEEIRPQEEKDNREKNNQLIKDLEDILICCICYNYLKEPVNDPTSCSHYACKNCLESYFKQLKSNIIPCPLCRKQIKKRNLVVIPIIESIKEILKDAKNNEYNRREENINEKCEVHPKNQVFYICLDCKKKMCPICNEEKKKHETHHLVNYNRYLQLFYFFHENFSEIKQTIVEKEKKIKEYNELIGIFEEQKNSYLNFLKNISDKIEKIYTENQENIKKEIANSMQIIAKLRNFMINVKSKVSAEFKNSYNDIENLEDFQEKIKERIGQLNLEKLNENNILIKKSKNLLINLSEIKKEIFPLIAKKKVIIENGNMSCKLGKEGIYSFGMELSEDKVMINIYLDINKFIGKSQKPNNCAYMAFLELENNGKFLYLEHKEIFKEAITFEKPLLFEQIFNEKEEKINIKLYILYSNII